MSRFFSQRSHSIQTSLAATRALFAHGTPTLSTLSPGAPGEYRGGGFLARAIILLVFTGLIGACDNAAEAQGGRGADGGRREVEAVVVRTAPARLGTIDRVVEVVGTLHGDEEATISAKVPGRIAAIRADVGDRVGPGAPLAAIDPTDYELVVQQRRMALHQALASLGLEALPGPDFDISTVATVERARFQAANARARLERARQLFEQKPPLISEQDYQDLETTYQVAERNRDVAELEARSQLALARSRASELDAALQRLADTVIRAPAVGTPAVGNSSAPTTAPATTSPAADRFGVAARLVSEGEYVREGDPLFRLVADDPIKFRGAVPERYVADVRVGQPVTVQVEGRQRAFSGRVTRISPAIDVATRTFQVEATFANPDRALRPGAFARASIRVGEEGGIAFVPRSALVSFAGTDKVFTLADGKAVEHRVTPLRRTGDEIPIRPAVEGEVVVFNADKLAADTPVKLESAAD